MEQQQQKKHGFIFMPGEDQGVAPVLAPGQLGKVRCKGYGTISKYFTRIISAFPFSFFTVHTSRAVIEQHRLLPSQLKITHFCGD